MINNKEDIVRLWTWCGWIYRESNPNHPQMKNSPYGMGWFHLQDKGQGLANIPPLSLDYIYAYAIPKLQEKGYSIELIAFEHKGFRVAIFDQVHAREFPLGIADTPTEALLNAIMKVIDNETH